MGASKQRQQGSAASSREVPPSPVHLLAQPKQTAGGRRESFSRALRAAQPQQDGWGEHRHSAACSGGDGRGAEPSTVLPAGGQGRPQGPHGTAPCSQAGKAAAEEPMGDKSPGSVVAQRSPGPSSQGCTHPAPAPAPRQTAGPRVCSFALELNKSVLWPSVCFLPAPPARGREAGRGAAAFRWSWG